MTTVLFTISVFGNATGKDEMTLSEKYDHAEKMIHDWSVSKEIDRLSEIRNTIRNLAEEDAGKSMTQKKMSLIFSLLNVMDKYYNPNYEKPQINIAPPVHDGVIYDSGISPDSIKEPDIRAEYEKAIAENKKKIEIANFQLKLGEQRKTWITYTVEYIGQTCKDKKKIDKLIDDNITSETTRKELKEKFTNKNSVENFSQNQ